MLTGPNTNRLDSEDKINSIKIYARSKGLKIISVGFYHEWCDYNLVLTPFELLSLFKNADSVVTDTFHGTIFSIISRKPFVSLLRYENKMGSNSNKLNFLLSQLGLETRIYNYTEDLDIQLNERIQYDKVDDCLEMLRETSMQYICDALSLVSTASNEGVSASCN
ncbi:MAG: polysaccharide pyruvyl transferase family protein [Candidatus Thiodiazotropha sp. (ex. Lucinoma kazani)]